MPLSEIVTYTCGVIMMIIGWVTKEFHGEIKETKNRLTQVEKEFVSEHKIKELILDKLAPSTIQFEYISKSINELRTAQASIEAKLDQLLLNKVEKTLE